MNQFKNQTKFDINDIIKILPHRYPFILIDKIEILEKGKSLVALKNTTINEPFFQGHFPGQPVMPGVLSLEMMAQAGSFLMLSEVEDPLSRNMFFSAVESSRFKKLIIFCFNNVSLIEKIKVSYSYSFKPLLYCNKMLYKKYLTEERSR